MSTPPLPRALSDNKTFFRSFPLENIHPTALIGLPPENRNHKVGTFHYGVFVASTARIGAYCTIDGGYEELTRIGERVWLMKSCHVGHDAQIDDDTEIAPHCSIGGHVVIGNHVKVGQGAIFKPRVRVGNGAIIGCGAVVVDDVPPHTVVVGNPARKLRMAYENNYEFSRILVQGLDTLAEIQAERDAEREQTDEEMFNEQFERDRTR